MNKNKILELLKTVNYPGFSRDIVSFGMVDDISLDGNSIEIRLKITTQNEEKKTAVIDSVNQVIEKTNSFKNINVTVQDGTPSAPQPQAPQSPEQQPAAPLDGVKHIIAVASGKGGVGKSTVAANLAISIKKSGHSVGLLDLDIYGPSLPIILGIQEQPELTQERKLVPLEHLGMKIMSFGFISGNQTPVIWRGPLVSRMTEQFFRDVEWGELDYLILDLPPGTGDVQLTLTQKLKIDGVIIVTTPQDIALADVRKGADMFKKVHTPVLGVIENMSGLFIKGNVDKGSNVTIEGNDLVVDSDGQFSIRIDLFKRGGGQSESDRLNVPLLGEIPIAQEIMEATDAGEPITSKNPEAHVSKIYQSISEKVLNALN
ncbi:MAG: Mrp/NBP35 family ATP-binding protein [Candidatus Marinimicrobia bacterium]|nr:Mrp/NBP35 family ATP-binding protein [Candidatus Neomarinimicrobiota bacterium]MBL7010287.1 Mrp/NBP35 family ATP-binding protein [Candidatus Neomarinimicrobiota bacterium]MBL7030191.1 Mrp/NBP35 family ATP-binding protein [Candidatus Neomarinimicrobiota bacterium]